LRNAGGEEMNIDPENLAVATLGFIAFVVSLYLTFKNGKPPGVVK
jgi:hypothetical protein